MTWDQIKDFGSIAGLLSLAWNIVRDFFGVIVRQIKRPRLKIENSSVVDWNVVPFGHRRFWNVEVVNKTSHLAEGCEANLIIKEVPQGSRVLQKTFHLHWADTPYDNRSSSMLPVDIATQHRLDVVFALPGQPSISVASAQALAIGSTVSQFILIPGRYKVQLKVICKNGRGDSKDFILTSPTNLEDFLVPQRS